MHPFAYARPHDEAQAVALVAEPGSTIIAGGTELLNWLRLGITRPDNIIDIGRLPDRANIGLEDGFLTLGALATLNQIGEHPTVGEHARVLGQACLLAASAQVRNRATIGGNVLQRTRCAYFRAAEPLPWACNKRAPGTGCPARHAMNDEHAIFGWTDDCVAVHPSDPLVALAALDADVDLVSPEGARRLPVGKLHLAQQEAKAIGHDPATQETVLRHDEMITGYRVPLLPGARSAYLKVRERQSYAYALATAAAVVQMDGDTIQSIRVALGSVAQRPWRLLRAETSLPGNRLSADTVREAVQWDLDEARPLSGNAYKVRLARNTAVRAIMAAVES
ncbi:xanthine dehydrogenase family protein subunit M [Pseudonocardia kujensis]|uniref:FAD binding domain-containing protein n=1 Tax=Pseudonocardia kujensis TaxID=1128675 RepID=UPI001E46B2AF|nr:xanthine dehydrogenase family protein subunit M [Pseudonocardia kujensis]MCE0767595.1 xanthine dehydrogenase family protein subunit M [Pseudonocardia kujensis]